MSANPDTVTVRLFAGLEQRARELRTLYEVTPADVPTVRDLRALLGPADAATGIVLVNGVHAVDEAVLRGGDEVALFPPLGGG